MFGRKHNPTNAADLLRLARIAMAVSLRAHIDEWLYQTGQFSRVANPPSDYPPQGSVHGGGHEAIGLLRDALTAITGDPTISWKTVVEKYGP